MSKFLAFVILFSFPIFSQNPGDNVFSGNKVYSIYIQFDQPNYWDSLTYYYSLGTEQYMMGRVTINGEVYDSIGVRLKGNSSYSHPNNKKSFRLGFGEYADKRWDGLKGVHLNNCWGDPTFMREKMYLDFCKNAGIHAPRSNFAEVYLNGELWGLYSLVEHVDKRLLGSHFDDNDGNLYKAVDGVGSTSQYVSDLVWYGSNPENYYNRYELKTDEPTNPWTDLVSLIDSINNSSTPQTSIKNSFNLAGYYKVLSTDILFSNLDSYMNSGRNYYLYNVPTTNKFEWIIWDAGLSFGGYVGGVTNYENISVLYVINAAQRPLISKIHSNSGLKDEYLQTLCGLHKQYFKATKLIPQIDSLTTLLRPYVYADQKKMYTNQQFELNINSDITVAGGTGSVRRPGLKSFVTLREANIQTQLTNLGISCEVAVNPGEVVINEFVAKTDSIFDPAGEAEDWIELYNNTGQTINLGGMYLSDSYTEPNKWQFPENSSISPNGYLVVWADEDSGQAGIHTNFKLSVDGEQLILSNSNQSIVDSVSFGVQTINISMGRVPNGTGNFVFCTPTLGLPNTNPSNIVYGEVVINEFAADNDSIPDPSGETDDWIEIYNKTTRTIDLSGIYLSDSFTNLIKWKFPEGATISPNGYIIVWADQDTTQQGYHSAFALSASGERIILSNKDLSVIDSVSYGVQTTNLSMARIPNGTGNFVMGTPTFNGPNSLTDISESENIPAEYSLLQNFPNPFNPSTQISFNLKTSSRMTLTVYDLLGREVVRLIDNEERNAGVYSVEFDGTGISSGVYIYRLTAGEFSDAKRMLLIK